MSKPEGRGGARVSTENGSLVPHCGEDRDEWWVRIQIDAAYSPEYAREIASALLESADLAEAIRRMQRGIHS